MTRRLALDVALLCFGILVILVIWALVHGNLPYTSSGDGPAQPASPGLTASQSVAGVSPAIAALHVPVAAEVNPVASVAAPIIGGRATWYPAHGDVAAAGPALRHYLGRHWRGSLVSVCASRCVVVRVSDWCQCGGNGHPRLLDLSDDAFAQLAPLSRGVIVVSITRAVRVPEPPATDTK